MQPTFGVLVQVQKTLWAVTVRHAIDGRDAVEIWSGIHPDVAMSFGCDTAAKELARFHVTSDADKYVADSQADLLAFPIECDLEYAFDIPGDLATARICDVALIVFTDYDRGEDRILRKYQDGVAGLISRVCQTYAVVSACGAAGMSGSPVVLKDDRDKVRLLGIYTGTPRTTPLTRDAVKEFAKVTYFNDPFIYLLTNRSSGRAKARR